MTTPTREIRQLEPRVIGATGGSGTRVVARIVRAAGLYIGTELNNYEDALPFAAFSDRWINEYLASGGEPSAETRTKMVEELEGLVGDHLSHRPEDAIGWGWKEPRSIYLLRFLNEEMPNLRFLHFVRDGRDLAFSENQQQLKKHGAAVLDGDLRWRRRPYRSVALWGRVNSAAADYGERELGERYLRVRFEDLCSEPGRQRAGSSTSSSSTETPRRSARPRCGHPRRSRAGRRRARARSRSSSATASRRSRASATATAASRPARRAPSAHASCACSPASGGRGR